jgi:hypothetical protein
METVADVGPVPLGRFGGTTGFACGCDQEEAAWGTMAEFDVFLSHNSKDKSAVRELARLLSARGIRVWLGEEQLVPGRPWQPLLERGIKGSATGAVLVGKDGLGPWESQEMQTLLDQAVSAGKPVIPVLLPDAPGAPELPLFLRNLTWVDLRPSITDEGLDKLVWGIRAEKSAGPGQGIRDNLANGTAAPELVHIPPGSYLMGSPINERGHREDERQHEVTVGEFYIGRYPVTFRDYDLFCEANKDCRPPFDHGWGRDNRPVIEVAFREAMNYLDWLCDQTGAFYRLPTESEWEYAARAGTQTRSGGESL